MRRTFPIATLAALATATCAHAAPPEEPVKTEAATFRVVEVAGGLEEPWGMAFLPDGGMLVTEKPGRLRLIEGGSAARGAGGRRARVYAAGPGRAARRGARPRLRAATARIYLTYSHAEGGRTTTRVMRARYASRGAHRAEGDLRGQAAGRQLASISAPASPSAMTARSSSPWASASASASRRRTWAPTSARCCASTGTARPARQPVRRPRGCPARDLHLRPPQPAGPRRRSRARARSGSRSTGPWAATRSTSWFPAPTTAGPR